MYNRRFELSLYCPSGHVDSFTSNGLRQGQWREEIMDYEGLTPIRVQFGSNNYSQDAKGVREAFRDYFNSPEGRVPWQYQMVTSTHNPFDDD